MLNYQSQDVIYDIETEGSTTIEFLREIYPPYPDFNPTAIKVGNLKTESEKDAKVELARQAHADQERQHWADKLDKAALNAETGRVVTIGYLRADAPDEDAVLDDADFDEVRLLRRFWNSYKRVYRERGRFVGWNSNGFDLPYLVKRSWILGVEVPSTIYKGKWISDTWLDLMAVWTCHGFKQWTKLDVCARVLGLGNKTDQECSGAEFARWYRDPKLHDQAVNYGKLDLTLTRAIYLRMCSVGKESPVAV
jgi:DNA polymerase elongation subunit (family B)